MSVAYRVIAPHELDSALISTWRGIQAGSGALASPYFCPEFTKLVGAVRDDVRLGVIENSGKPVAFFPYQRTFLGQGRPVGGPLSDYHGVISENGSEWNLHDLMRATGLATWVFDHLVDCSGRFEPHITARSASPQMDLGAGFESYMKAVRNGPSDFARKARKMAREVGELSFTLHDASLEPMRHLLQWKSEQYRRSGLPDAFGVRWTRNLLREILSIQTADFAGVCSVLRAGDQVVAVHAGMRSRGMLHWWFPAYDRKFEKYSPGIVLLFRIAEAVCSVGVNVIDLGKGDDRYKRSVMTGEATLAEGFVERPSLLSKARQFRRFAEAREARGGMSRVLRFPLRAIRRIERTVKYR